MRWKCANQLLRKHARSRKQDAANRAAADGNRKRNYDAFAAVDNGMSKQCGFHRPSVSASAHTLETRRALSLCAARVASGVRPVAM